MKWRTRAVVAVWLAGQVLAGAMDTERVQEAEKAIQGGLRWLEQNQQADGHWSNPDFPALTALPLWALAQDKNASKEAVDRAVAYLLSCVHEDGSIWREPAVKKKGGGLANYNTAICMVALNATGRKELIPVIQRARKFVARSQHRGEDMFKGGMGYDADTGRPYADLSNSYMAYEAMRLTENVEDLRASGDERADLDWQAAAEFIQRVQNRPESNDQPWASDDPEAHGGFAYKPDSSQAGTFTNQEGEVCLRSYGSMTYAGLLSFIYAQVDKADPRVASAFDWSRRHWTLEENPGMGQQGLYYFYNVLSKALATYGQDELALEDGSRVHWRDSLVRKLAGLQKQAAEGGGAYWSNEENRWWEGDPVLVTSYAVLALQATLNKGETR